MNAPPPKGRAEADFDFLCQECDVTSVVLLDGAKSWLISNKKVRCQMTDWFDDLFKVLVLVVLVTFAARHIPSTKAALTDFIRERLHSGDRATSETPGTCEPEYPSKTSAPRAPEWTRSEASNRPTRRTAIRLVMPNSAPSRHSHCPAPPCGSAYAH